MASEVEGEAKSLKAKVLMPEEKLTRKLYNEVNEKLKQDFGENSRAYQKITAGINFQESKGSYFLFNTAVQNYLTKINSKKRVATLEDIEQIYQQHEDILRGIHTHPPEIILRNKDSTYSINSPIIENLEGQLSSYGFSPENPLRITNPEIIKDKQNPNNIYGILLNITENTKIQNDQRFSYENNLGNFPLDGKFLDNYTKDKGMSAIQIGNGNYIDTGGLHDNLTSSSRDSRIILIK